MNEVNINDLVTDGNRRGIVVKVNDEIRKAQVALDASDEAAGGASATRWFEFSELSPAGEKV